MRLSSTKRDRLLKIIMDDLFQKEKMEQLKEEAGKALVPGLIKNVPEGWREFKKYMNTSTGTKDKNRRTK
jgi:hypothetical protein